MSESRPPHKGLEDLHRAVEQIEAHRQTLGDTTADLAIRALRNQIQMLLSADEGGMGDSLGLPDDERRVVTVVFADISGFTTLAEEHDPESVRDLMNQCFERLVPIIARYEGTVDKFIGDEIMALFGAPVAHENDPERALRCALDLMTAIEGLGREPGLNLEMHCGVNTGPVVAGAVGSGSRREYSVLGDAVNLAARLEDASKRGEILVGPDTFRLTSSVFDFEALGPAALKGKAEPVRIYRLIGLKSSNRFRRVLPKIVGVSPLVGRKRDVSLMREALGQLSEGVGGFVRIVGDTGIGKTRLIAETRLILPSIGGVRGFRWFEAHAQSFDRSLAYQPFQAIMREFAGIREDHDEAESWKKLISSVRSVVHEQSDVLSPYLAMLINVEPPAPYTDRIKHLDAEAVRRQIYTACRRFFQALSQQVPTILVFEDIHWMDESSVLLLDHLAPLTGTFPLLITAAGRPRLRGRIKELFDKVSGNSEVSYKEIRLGPLSKADSLQLVRNLLPSDHIPGMVMGKIVGTAEGNPFYLEEILRALVFERRVAQDSATGKWNISGAIDAVETPDTIRGVIAARVDRLDADARQVLKTAAVLGRIFQRRVLQDIISLGPRVDDHLSELKRGEFIDEFGPGPEPNYRFRHDIVQRVAYESLLLQQRKELHSKAAESMKALNQDRLEEVYSLPAFHYTRAEVWDKAQEYLLLAGDQAGGIPPQGPGLPGKTVASFGVSAAAGHTL